MAWPASTAPSSAVNVRDERLNGVEHNGLRIAEQVFVVLELVELVGERLDLLHLVFDHLDVFGDVLRLRDDLLHVDRRVIDDPLRASRCGDTDRHERECDESFHGVPFVVVWGTAATRRQSREKV
jgi:hypothetical protein